MRRENPHGEFIDLIGKISRKATGADEGGFEVGTLKKDGSIDMGETVIKSEDYIPLRNPVSILNNPVQNAGTDLLMVQLEDGDYIVLGGV